jgi:hypothetical protein
MDLSRSKLIPSTGQALPFRRNLNLRAASALGCRDGRDNVVLSWHTPSAIEPIARAHSDRIFRVWAGKYIHSCWIQSLNAPLQFWDLFVLLVALADESAKRFATETNHAVLRIPKFFKPFIGRAIGMHGQNHAGDEAQC